MSGIPGNRFDALLDTAAVYQKLAKENYDRVREIAEGIRAGFCAFLAAQDGVCVRLVPPAGPFQPHDYGDAAFSMPPRGFRHIAPIAFGLAVRVTHGTDWLRMMVTCIKSGDNISVSIADGPTREFPLPFNDNDHQEFYAVLYHHVLEWLNDRIDIYNEGAYGGTGGIGFDFSDDSVPGDGLLERHEILTRVSEADKSQPKKTPKVAEEETKD